LTGHAKERILAGMDSAEGFWGAWERILENRDPDPLQVLRAAAAFANYFEAVERDGIAFARAKGHTWAQIAEALGSSRQAVWQRASRDGALQAQLRSTTSKRWEALRRDPDSWYQATRPFPA
jgi:hypothetical protein